MAWADHVSLYLSHWVDRPSTPPFGRRRHRCIGPSTPPIKCLACHRAIRTSSGKFSNCRRSKDAIRDVRTSSSAFSSRWFYGCDRKFGRKPTRCRSASRCVVRAEMKYATSLSLLLHTYKAFSDRLNAIPRYKCGNSLKRGNTKEIERFLRSKEIEIYHTLTNLFYFRLKVKSTKGF